MVEVVAFYLFATVTVVSAMLVISARNPVHAVLFLILAFINAAGLFVLMGAEFVALILVIVYVGAVAVLFLFVVMMLDIDVVRIREGFLRYLPIGALVGLILLLELILVLGATSMTPEMTPAFSASAAGDITNTQAIGRILYTHYVYFFLAAGMILLVAMIGAIVLTLRPRVDIKRQDVGRQVARRRDDGVEIVKVPSGQGLV
jgi:NADH-quinone oxidoreductase subunit J